MVRNVHERLLAPPAVSADVNQLAGTLIDSLASADDRLWPHDRWPALRLSRPLDARSPAGSLWVGADGGHGPIRYRVISYDPGRQVTFEFSPSDGLRGWHRLELEPLGDDDHGVILRHVLWGRLRGWSRLTWPLAVRWLHDALVEDLLDRAERSLGASPRDRAWSLWVRILRRVFRVFGLRRGRRSRGAAPSRLPTGRGSGDDRPAAA